MQESATSGSAHELLLALAGRVDDDLLACARELVAVGEDARAVELVAAALAADRAALPASVRAGLVGAAQAARIGLDADAALAAAGEDTEHRFTGTVPAGAEHVVTAVQGLPARLLDGSRVSLAWRLTPAGAAPGPLPHPVVLVETEPAGRPADVLAYQLSVALDRAGVLASVEVLTTDAPLSAYHAAARRDALPIGDDAPAAPAPADEAPPWPDGGPFGGSDEPGDEVVLLPAFGRAADAPPARDDTGTSGGDALSGGALTDDPLTDDPLAGGVLSGDPLTDGARTGDPAAGDAGPVHADPVTDATATDPSGRWIGSGGGGPGGSDAGEPPPIGDEAGDGDEPGDGRPLFAAPLSGPRPLTQRTRPALPRRPAPVDDGTEPQRPPGPRPVPLRSAYDGGRRRRPEAALEPAPRPSPRPQPDRRPTVTPISSRTPTTPPRAVAPVRHDDPPAPRVLVPVEEPQPDPLEEGQVPALAETPTFAAMQDPLSGPLNTPLLDPLLDPTPPSDDEDVDDDPFGFAGVSPLAPDPLAPDSPAPAAVEARWTREWASGDWAVAATPHAQPDGTGDPQDDGTDPEQAARHRSFDAVRGQQQAEPDVQQDDEHDVHRDDEQAVEVEAADERPEPVPPAPSTRPDTSSRLSDADRDLLARLQAEMGQTRPRVIRRAGVAPNNGTNGAGPPDIAG